MKALVLLITLCFAYTSYASACCAERDYRLFPLGELNKEAIFIEFDLSRNCFATSMVGSEREYRVRGTVRLVQSSGDSLLQLHPADTIAITECACDQEEQFENTVYEKELAKYYQKALGLARQQKGSGRFGRRRLYSTTRLIRR
jgi:hypothetical protein